MPAPCSQRPGRRLSLPCPGVLSAPSTENSPVEVLGTSDGHEAVGVGELGEAADLVVLLEGSSHSHDEEEEENVHLRHKQTRSFLEQEKHTNYFKK